MRGARALAVAARQCCRAGQGGSRSRQAGQTPHACHLPWERIATIACPVPSDLTLQPWNLTLQPWSLTFRPWNRTIATAEPYLATMNLETLDLRD